MKKILIIEDEILIQQSLKKMIMMKGHTVDATSSGSEGLEMIFHHHYDKIVCDLMLQDISGFDILEATKKKMGLSFISQKFLIMTAYSSSQILNKASSYHLSILNKPFRDIVSVINMILE